MRIEGELVKAKFVKRLNRFVALVEVDGVQEFAHVPNTGRLKELLVDGAAVMVRSMTKLTARPVLGSYW